MNARHFIDLPFEHVGKVEPERNGAGRIADVSSAYAVGGISDFDGDFKSDVLWRNAASGDVVEWLMNGSSIAGGGSVGNVAAD